MAEHGPFGSSSGAGSVDNRGQIVRLNRTGGRFGLRVESGGALGHEFIHVPASDGKFGGNLDVIHDDDFLNLRLGENRLQLAQLMFGGKENDAGAGIAESICGLFGSQRRIDGDANGPKQENGEVGGGPLRAILAENGDAISFANAPVRESASGSGHVTAKIRRRYGQPLSHLAIEHGAVKIAFGGGKEDVVQRGQAHGLEIVTWN